MLPRRHLSRREFLRLGGAGVAGAAFLASCSDYVSHVGSAFTGSERRGADSIVFAFGPDDTGAVQKAIDRFNKENGKGITVEWREMPADSAQYFDKLRTEFQGGGGDIDVVGGDVIWPAQFAANGWIADISDLFTEDMRSQYLETPIQVNSFKDKVYGVPWFTDAGLLYYRKDLLDKAGVSRPPATWDDVMEIGQKIVEAGDAQYGMVMQGAEYEGGVVNGCEFVWNAGGDILDPQDPGRITIDSKEAADGLDAYRSLVEERIAPESVAVYKETESYTAFLGDGYVFCRHWPYVLGIAQDPEISVLKPDQIGVARLPVIESGTESVSGMGGWNFFINSASRKKEQAWEFIKFMSEDSSQRDLAINGSYLPTKKKIYEDQEVLDKQPAVALAKEATANTKARPAHPFYSDMSLVLAEGYNETLKGSVSPPRALRDMQGKLDRIARIGAEVFDLGGSGGGAG